MMCCLVNKLPILLNHEDIKNKEYHQEKNETFGFFCEVGVFVV